MIFSLFRGNKEPARVTIDPLGRQIEVPKGQSILQAALDAGIDFPHSCKVGTCTECRCKLLAGEVKAIRDFSYVLSAEEIREGYILACQARVKPGSEARVQVALEPDRPRFVEATLAGRITAMHPLTHDIVDLRVQVNQPVAYAAGQYATLLQGDMDRGREYSFAAAPVEGGRKELSFFIRRVPGGRFTEWLFAADRTGEALTVNGPHGDFWLREDTAPLLFVAGGSGLAPIKAILEDCLARGINRPARFLFGARSQRDLYCLEEMHRIAAGWPGFTFVPVLSEEPADSDWQGARGLVTEAIDGDQIGDIAAHHAYLCGPPPMIDAAIEILAAAGVPREHVHYDKFIDSSNLVG